MVGLVCLVLCTLNEGSVFAQGFSYTSTTAIEIPGKLGSLVSAAASLTGSNVLEETVFILGDKMRVDKGNESVITDLEWQTITTMRHEEMTFEVVTFDQILTRLESAKNQLDMADFAMEEAGVQVESVDLGQSPNLVSAEEIDKNIQFSFNLEWSGQKKRLQRLPVEQAYLTLIATSKDDQTESQSGTFVVFNDMWVTQDIDGYASLKSFQMKAAELMGSAFGGSGGWEKLQSALVKDARIDVLMESVREQSQQLTGIPILTDTYVVLVSENNTFDQEQVMQTAPKRSGLKGAFRAVRRQINNESTTSEQNDGQNTLAKITITLSDFSTNGVGSQLFEVPSNYVEVVN